MSNFISIGEILWATIYNHLNLSEKYSLATTNKTLYAFFNNYPILDYELNVNGEFYEKSEFLFKNITRITLKDQTELQYLTKFINLKIMNISCINFNDSLAFAKLVVKHLSGTLKSVHVTEDSLELIVLALHFYNSQISICVAKNNGKKRCAEKSDCNDDTKKLRTSHRTLGTIQEKIDSLELYKSRINYAMEYPSSFLPENLFKKFPEISSDYKAVIDWIPLHVDVSISKDTIDLFISQLKDLLIHSVVINQKNGWVFITQIETYIKDKSLDDVATVTKFDECPDMLTIKMEKCNNERGGTWYELCFMYLNIEIIATGGFSHHAKDESKVDAFLGVAAPATMAEDDMFILFSPVKAVETESCVRMLRDYSKKESLKPWCFKSTLYMQKSFHTPLPLEFYETEPPGYLRICSKLIHLAAHKAISFSEINNLRNMLNDINYWKDLGFEEKVDDEKVLVKLQEIKKIKNPRSRKPSEAKRSLIELLLTYSNEQPINSNDYTSLYNRFLYPKVKILNKQRVKMILKE